MKRIKMVLYGDPGVGKSTFAIQAPKPFFICTDGNYEWLEEFGADPNAHAEVSSWSEAKKIFSRDFADYETIVLDLTEDLFKWCEYEYCVRNKIDHLSDLGYGKAYDTTRTEFFIEICKLFSKDKHVILIMHGSTYTVKDRRGVEHTMYGPTSRIPDKVMSMIEGRVRYFLRCYLKDEERADGTLMKQRYLSLIPKPNEFGIARGLNEDTTPHDIPLSWSEFVNAIGLETDSNKKTSPVVSDAQTTSTSKRRRTKSEVQIEAVQETNVGEIADTLSNTKDEQDAQDEQPTTDAQTTKDVDTSIETIKPSAQTNDEKLAAIRAKLAQLRTNK